MNLAVFIFSYECVGVGVSLLSRMKPLWMFEFDVCMQSSKITKESKGSEWGKGGNKNGGWFKYRVKVPSSHPVSFRWIEHVE